MDLQQHQQQRSWTNQFRDFWQKFNLANLLFCYCLPFFYMFYPTLLMPAIFLRLLSFFVGRLYQLVLAHHKDPTTTAQRRRQQRKHRSRHNRPASPSSPSSSSRVVSSDSDDNDGMEYWMQKCSICLSKRYALCLESCRDQFCKPCFQRYIEEIVHASWGLGVTRIKCPVCQEHIKQSEWSRYVPAAMVERYEKYNQPYRPFSRYCPTCRAQVAPCQSPRSQGLSRQKRIERIAAAIHELQMYLPVKSSWLEPLRRGSSTIGRIQTLYHQMTPVLRQAAQDPHLYPIASDISKQLVALEVVPEAWKRAQFWHVANFPVESCGCGHDMCLQCGEEAHPRKSCMDNLQRQQTASSDAAESSTVQWKLDHTRPCPCCSVMINRDEGCNKVDCLFCGYQFCWSCCSGWSQQTCGFYRCREGGQEERVEPYTKVELGVPNTEFLR